ncbi:MAG: S9 family peptidase [Culturomica sp.]|jgi:dipeptidyl-peptidase-4|nr:S9 family peptidase [Culturomica sp.]
MYIRLIFRAIICFTIILCFNINNAKCQHAAEVQNVSKLSLEDFFANNTTFRTKQINGLRSMNDGEHYTMLANGNRLILRYSYKTGKLVDTLFNVAKFTDNRMKHIDNYQFNSDESRVLIEINRRSIYRRSYTADYFIYDFKNNELKPLSDEGSEQLATFSPDGWRIAFVRNNNIFIHDIRFGSERQITFDGKRNSIINGAPDWAYEEEFGFNRAFEWSVDGSSLAFMRFDETDVKEFQMNIFEGQNPAITQNELYPSVYSYKYPKSGEKNSVVSVHVYDIKDRTTLKMDTGEDSDIYIPRIKWTKDPKKLAIIRLNRLQNKMEVLLANARVGTTTVLYRDENDRYIDEINLDNLFFLDNGTEFVVSNEKSGFMHLYLYSMTGNEKMPLTKGGFDVTDFYGYDKTRKVFYYSSYEESPLEKHLYSVDLKGVKKKLTTDKGWNETDFSSNFNYRINTFSTVDTPPMVKLLSSKNKVLRTLEDNSELKDVMSKYGLAKREFLQVPSNVDGVMLNAWIMKPLNFDENNKYPVLMTQYSGPNSQQVKDSWGGVNWLHYLAQEGYVVICVDPRGTGGRGEEFKKCTYMQLGKYESDDLIAVGRWLQRQKFVDAGKIGIWGWSFGGFMSASCIMKGGDVFAAAISVAPVTHFKYYDSIYTERFMRRPSDNKEGYEDNAPLNMANKLKGKLLLCHGTADDNVHVQNTYELAERLVQANKQFDMAIYTNRNHNITGGKTRLQLYTKFVDFLNENLK